MNRLARIDFPPSWYGFPLLHKRCRFKGTRHAGYSFFHSLLVRSAETHRYCSFAGHIQWCFHSPHSQLLLLLLFILRHFPRARRPPLLLRFLRHCFCTHITSTSPLLPLRSNPPLCSQSFACQQQTPLKRKCPYKFVYPDQQNNFSPFGPSPINENSYFPYSLTATQCTHSRSDLGHRDRHSERILERTRLAAVRTGVLDLSEPERQFRLLVATVAEIVRIDGHLSRESKPPHLRNCACTSDAPFRP